VVFVLPPPPPPPPPARRGGGGGGGGGGAGRLRPSTPPPLLPSRSWNVRHFIDTHSPLYPYLSLLGFASDAVEASCGRRTHLGVPVSLADLEIMVAVQGYDQTLRDEVSYLQAPPRAVSHRRRTRPRAVSYPPVVSNSTPHASVHRRRQPRRPAATRHPLPDTALGSAMSLWPAWLVCSSAHESSHSLLGLPCDAPPTTAAASTLGGHDRCLPQLLPPPPPPKPPPAPPTPRAGARAAQLHGR
jgi:hypothetical protein